MLLLSWALLCLSVLVSTAPVTQHEEEFLEFNHPKILPEHPDNFRKDKLKSHEQQQDYVSSTRLPNNFYILSYDLWFKPYFPAPGVTYDAARNFTFDGSASIMVESLVVSDRIVINCFNLTINSYKVTDVQNNEVPINSISQDNDKQQLSLISNANAFDGGNFFYISINYTGIINPYTQGGLYYTSYNDPQGATHYMLATHMEPFSARKVFPCFDEPSYKAEFTITLEYPTSQVALSNMKEPEGTSLGNGWSRATFPVSKMMSTYLVAFAVGPYVSAQTTNGYGTLVRAWGWPGTEQYLQFAAENSANCLYQLANWTGVPYPLEKSDQIGMPEFLAGAMENWGLIIYKYQYIAYNPTTMTTRNMQAAAKVMCHELAHQWFGDLVTTAWWDDLFLNEGFADYFMTFIQQKVYPSQMFYLDTIQVLNELQVGLNADVSKDAHPLIYPDGPAFDDITYNKGASMLRMLSDILSEDVFKFGISNYLNSKKYSNAVDRDLFAILTQTARDFDVQDGCGNFLNVTDFMQPYIHQINHPILYYSNNQVYGLASITQAPFGNTSTMPPSPYNYQWNVPILVSTYDHPDERLQWLNAFPCSNNDDNKIKKKAVHWELGSVHSATYGRIIYDDVGFDRIIQHLQQNQIADNIQLTLLADEYYYLTREKNAGRQYNYNRFLNLAKVIFNSQPCAYGGCYSVFAQAQPVLEEISKYFLDTIDAPLIARMYKLFFNNAYSDVVWKDTNSWNTDTFAEVFLPVAVRYDIGDVQNVTLTMFGNIKSACIDSQNGTAWCNPYTTNVRRAVYCGAAKYAPPTSDYFFQMLHFYNKEVVTNPYFYQEYMALLEGMACTQQSTTLKTIIKLFTTSTLNPYVLFGFLKVNPYAPDALYNYMLNNPGILNTVNLDAYLDAMTYTWASYDRESQFNDLILAINPTDPQMAFFDKYFARITDQWQYRTSNGVSMMNWLYDNTVVIGNVPWPKALRGDLRPDSYDINIQTFIPGAGQYDWTQNMTFTGTVGIQFEVMQPTSVITLNLHRIIVEPGAISLSVTFNGNTSFIDLDATLATKDYEKGIINLPLKNGVILYPNVYYLETQYTGFIFPNPNEGNTINTYYSGINGKKGYIFSTDFEGGPGARSLIPCFDEPSYKAQFQFVVTHPSDMIALTNTMESTKTAYEDGWTTVEFKVTEQMSSYLLAVCVGHFSNIAKVTNRGILVRMWTWSGMELYGEVALNVTAGTLEFMESYFQYSYLMEKLDVMALPEYTQGAGAMENWGLIIGEYSLFMVDLDYATAAEIAEVAETAAHETVHQWFGDTVTMDWWNDIFLNEGFAQYWYANGINYTYPEQQDYAIDYNRFHVNRIALLYDCLPGVAKPVISDQPPVFGIEPYYKGSALLNLLSNTLTPFVLQQGLIQYIYSYGLGNAGPEDLWKTLTVAASQAGIQDWNGNPLDVANLMRPFTLKTSYPIIYLQQHGTGTVMAVQESCMQDSTLWNIPVFTQTTAGTQFAWFTQQNGGNDTVWTRPTANPFRIDNVGSSSFTRIQYDDKSWLAIQQQLLNDPSVFSSTTRAMLLDDAYFFYLTGRWGITKFLDLSLYLTKEDALAPWQVAIDVMSMLQSRFTFTDINSINTYVTQMTSNAFKKYGFVINNSWSNNRLANMLTNINCRAGNRQCRQVALILFENFITKCQYSTSGTGKCAGVGPDLRKATYCYGMLQSTASSDMTVLENLFNQFQTPTNYLGVDSENLLHAMGCTMNVTLLQQKIDAVVMAQFPTNLLGYIAEHDKSGTLLYNYFLANVTKVLMAPFNFNVFGDAMTLNWSTDAQLKSLNDFMSTSDYNQLDPNQKKYWNTLIANVQSNINWLNANQNQIITWVLRNFGGGQTN